MSILYGGVRCVRQRLHAQDSDGLWMAAPPARDAMRHMLAAHNATLTLGWHIRRDAPLAGTHGGPECGGVQVVPLAARTRAHLVSVLQVRPAPPDLIGPPTAASRRLAKEIVKVPVLHRKLFKLC